MRKSEIREHIKDIIDSIELCLENVDDILSPYTDIEEHLKSIEEIQDNEGIDIGLDFEQVLGDTLRSCLENHRYIEDIHSNFESLICDLENWLDEVSESRQELIQEKYIDVLNEIIGSLDYDSIQCREDLESQLEDLKTHLEEMEV